jgi:predicted acyl esterase
VSRLGRPVALLLIACAVALVASACVPLPDKVSAHGGTEQLWVRTDPNASVELLDSHGDVVPTYLPQIPLTTVLTRRTDANGRLILRYVKPGRYTVRRTDSALVKPSDVVTVTKLTTNPPHGFYTSQEVKPGYGYIPMRDGTTLAAMVRLPGPPDKGPYPTVIEYSGYDPANPDSPEPSEQLANALGFATVGVNLRGTGCSGGGFQLWEHQQSSDGYDIVEAVAAQPWVLNHKVGLVGISFPAITSLFAAQTQPPSLAAIAPVSVLDDAFRSLLKPGGILNTGFTIKWLQERTSDSQPGGQAWSQKRIDAGDITCIENQRFRPAQNFDLGAQVNNHPYYPSELGIGDSLSPRTFVNKINVPVFLAGAWQDEQTGSRFATMLDRFTSSPAKHFYLVNGAHTEGYAVPLVLSRWLEFLQFYVARKIPDTGVLRNLAGPVVIGAILGQSPVTNDPYPPDRFTGYKSYADALAAYQRDAPVHVLFDNGAGTGTASGVPAGLPAPAFMYDFPSWPVPGTTPTAWYLGPDGALTRSRPAAGGPADTIDTYVSDPPARPAQSLPGGNGVWQQLPPWNWAPVVGGKSLSYVTGPLTNDTVMIGTGSVDLWLRSSATDTDLQATLSEVRPDGKETYIQSGWLRAGLRKLDPLLSSRLNPVQSMLERDAALLPSGEFVPVRIGINPFGHAFRPGSRIRITIEAPGGDKPAWAFGTLPGTQTNDIARSVARPSAVVLPVINNLAIPTPLPPCPSLRGQPCRTYVTPAANS